VNHDASSFSVKIADDQAQKVIDDKEPLLQELRAKIRVLEAKREDEARHVRELETRLEEAERFVAVRPKLQAKLAQQQTELIDVRRDLADAKQLAELTESRTLDAQEQLEMAMLDKEVAEERAETAELEVEELKEKLASMEVELDVIKSGGAGECACTQRAGRLLTLLDGKVVEMKMIQALRLRCSLFSLRNRMND
jgi:chromosome segregation ATPase